MAILFPQIKELKESGKSGILFPIAQKLSGGRVPSVVQRFFTNLSAAGGQHISIGGVTPDFIEMTVMSPTGSTVGLPTGATTPTANKLETINFPYSGDPIIYIGRNGSNYFSGYIADVKFFAGGTLIRHYPLDDSGVTNVARELVSGADGTRVNLTAASTEQFTKTNNTWVNGDGTKFIFTEDSDPILAYLRLNNVQGAYYTPWDKSTLFQDTAGTIPVTADGDPVGLMLDVSGNDNHVDQPISSRRPIYRDGLLNLDFNGVNNHINITNKPPIVSAANGFSFCAVSSKRANSSPLLVSQYDALAGRRIFGTCISSTSQTNYRGFIFNGSNFSDSLSITLTAPIDTAHTLKIRWNGIGSGATGSTSSPPDTATQPSLNSVDWVSLQDLEVGTYRGLQWFNGKLGGMFYFRSAIPQDKLDEFEQYLASKAGITL